MKTEDMISHDDARKIVERIKSGDGLLYDRRLSTYIDQCDNLIKNMHAAFRIIEQNSAELCRCQAGDDENGIEFKQCDVCRTRAYTLCHAFGTCHDGCPVKQNGLEIVAEEIRNPSNER